MKKRLLSKTLVIGISLLFIGATIVPTIIGDYNNEQDTTTLTFYTFDKTGTKKCKVELSTDVAEDISSLFEELKYKITSDPNSDETKVLKVDFINLLDANGLVPNGLSKDKVFSLLNPRWNRWVGNNNPYVKDSIPRSTVKNDVLPMQSSNSGSAFFCSMAGGGAGLLFPPVMIPRPRLATIWAAYIDAMTIASNLYTGHGFAAIGPQIGVALGFMGIGLSFAFPGSPAVFGFGGYALLAFVQAEDVETYPPNQVPIISEEQPSDGSVNVPNSLSELSFRISDADSNSMSYSVTTNPDIGSGSGSNVADGTYTVPVSGLNSNTEYSWHVVVSDSEDITEQTFSFRTAIEAPFVSDPSPVDGDGWVSVDISEMSFRLEDFQGDLMDYTVETVPDIGSDSASDVGDGVYSVDVGGLEYSRDYSWFVNVTDGEYWTRRIFVFKTQPMMVFDPFDEGWIYRKKITINHSQVAGDFSDFPVLISISDIDLRDKAQADGDDVLFMDGSGVANRLFHEIEMYDDSSGELVAWVSIPSLSSTVDTVLYMYYGNPSSNSQQFPERVWDSDYIMVQHMDIQDSTIYDSTLNDNDGYLVSSPYNIDGVISNAVQFDGKDDAIEVPYDSTLESPDLTFELWGRITGSRSDGMPHNYFALKRGRDHWSNTDGHQFSFQGYWHSESGTRRFRALYERNSASQQHAVGDSVGLNNTWYHFSTIFDKDTYNAKFYMNGSLKATEPMESEVIWYNDNSGFSWAKDYRPTPLYMHVSVDETRISSVVRSAEWISTSFNTMSDPIAFFSLGPEESSP